MSDLLDEIRERLMAPERFMPSAREEGVSPMPHQELQARAVATLFDTAEPPEDSVLREIDLPAELRDAAAKLREAAEEALSNERSTPEQMQPIADRLGFLANIVEDMSHLIENPATVLETLRQDRDSWQILAEQRGEMLGLTEAALGTSQGAVTELAEGQDKLVKLLENVVRFYEGQPPILPGFQPDVGRKADDLAMLINGLVPLGAYSYRVAVEIQRALDQEHRRPPDVLPEIHAILNQLTAIETNAEGRLVVASVPAVADDPKPAAQAVRDSYEPAIPSQPEGPCLNCGDAFDKHEKVADSKGAFTGQRWCPVPF